MKDTFDFRVLKSDKNTKARVGEIHTPHGKIEMSLVLQYPAQPVGSILAGSGVQDLQLRFI